MLDKKTDRRSLRTQTLLHEALITLFLKKDYEAVTIKDIVDEANVGRSTFYAHFTGKDDLLRSGFEKLRAFLIDQQRDAFAKKQNDEPRLLGFSLTMFEHTRSHIDLYRALIGGRGGIICLNCIRQILADLVRNELTETTAKSSADAVPEELVVQYVVGAYMAVLTWWLDRKAKLPPEKIDEMFRRMALQGILSPIT
ncbi:MAG: TetR/AcrR family transcriptional regulator [Alphaproteobacteria bacterium]|jgi:AcrR family transcriptional regulator|nr:TetR/AcrR family transcriptional regulator [Alphaproteobacteria bacterium]MBT7944401.1 TetR/AcrR family transcriptional regulator [Alphaproteobacteria bacterium]